MSTSKFFDEAIDDLTFRQERKAIGETPESRTSGLESLKTKLLQIEHLRPRLDDEFLLRFLRVAKFDEKKACDRIRRYYNTKKTYSHIFKDFYPSAAKTVQKTGRFVGCPHRTENHSVIFVLKRGMFDPSIMNYEEEFLMYCLILDFISANPLTQVCGVHFILDFAGYNFQHFVNDTPGRVRMGVEAMQNSIPLRYKTIHIINAPQIFSILFNLFYPFLTKKIKNRLHFHKSNDWKSLHSILPPELLPVDYGGVIPNSDLIDLTDEIIKKDSEFKEQLQYGFIKKT